MITSMDYIDLELVHDVEKSLHTQQALNVETTLYMQRRFNVVSTSYSHISVHVNLSKND